MTVRVMLVAPALGAELREARFGDERPLTEADLAPARACEAPSAGLRLSAPAPRCRQTAEALGLAAATVEPALADLDAGAWRGRPLTELASAAPESVAAWLSDPAFAPPGGESVAALCTRVGGWLDALPADSGRVLAVAEPAAVRAAVVHALALPAAAFWRLDVAPLTLTSLVGRAGRWNLSCGSALPARPSSRSAATP
ncbi:histidine phosphatase family protein [Streptomyces sp. TLI_171]|uniref:histidine phosphatase family protein n=1 Tax=Streptomyces sp. TLI_171 TaxID=1938859 RepID=UPI000C1747E2|nr:histidine phosphatase family protein [Streptomyces sp. TLI_171]RKE22981.1 broad specificity phosphatase PhoE [Streptomyces sp. TLI_171]